jgi:hypothetical protein
MIFAEKSKSSIAAMTPLLHPAAAAGFAGQAAFVSGQDMVEHDSALREAFALFPHKSWSFPCP